MSMTAGGRSLQISGAGGRTDDLRRSNLGSILRIVHVERRPSRAVITQSTGLNRATVGVCLAELVDRGLVVEAPPESGRAGRPSPIILPADDVVAITVDLEVDGITLGLVALGGRVIDRWHVETGAPSTASETVRIVARELSSRVTPSRLRIAGIGVAVPGQVRLSDGVVREASHFGWSNEPLAAELTAATGLPTLAANGAVLAMRAESAFGAGRRHSDLVFIMGGASGIGGGVVAKGEWLTGASGYAGEFGHTLVRSEGRECHCGASGCLEAELTQEELLDAVGLPPRGADDLGRALLESDDPRVAAVVREKLALLAVSVRNAVNVVNPDVVVLGGYLGALYSARPVDWDAGQRPIAAARDVPIVTSQVGPDQVILGAAELAFSPLLDDPLGWELKTL